MNCLNNLVLVEDNKNDAHLVIRILKKCFPNLEINWIKDGEKALHFFSNLTISNTHTLVLLDIQLPKYSGFEILRKIRSSATMKDMKVVIFSSSNQEIDINHAYQYKANCFVTKPNDYLELKKMLPAMINFWGL